MKLRGKIRTDREREKGRKRREEKLGWSLYHHCFLHSEKNDAIWSLFGAKRVSRGCHHRTFLCAPGRLTASTPSFQDLQLSWTPQAPFPPHPQPPPCCPSCPILTRDGGFLKRYYSHVYTVYIGLPVWTLSVKIRRVCGRHHVHEESYSGGTMEVCVYAGATTGKIHVLEVLIGVLTWFLTRMKK